MTAGLFCDTFVKKKGVTGGRNILEELEKRGVKWSDKHGKWVVHYPHNGHQYYVGSFDKVEDAISAIEYVENNPNSIL